jgi:hypothetical protein
MNYPRSSGSVRCGWSRYYTGAAEYVRRGPPHVVLRVIGPLVIITSLEVLATGVALLWTQPDGPGLLLTAHKAGFILWFGLMTVHVLGHLREAVRDTARDLRPTAGDPASRRRGLRAVALIGALAVGVGLAFALTPFGSAWHTIRFLHHN